MKDRMKLKVITKEGVKLDQEVDQAILPAYSGQIEILPGHAATVVLLSEGKLIYDGSALKTEKGAARIYNDEITIFTEGAKSRAVKGFS